MSLTLEEYDSRVGFHLRMMSHHGKMIAFHAEKMTHQPNFESQTEDELVQLDAALAAALGRVQHALKTLRGKPID